VTPSQSPGSGSHRAAGDQGDQLRAAMGKRSHRAVLFAAQCERPGRPRDRPASPAIPRQHNGIRGGAGEYLNGPREVFEEAPRLAPAGSVDASSMTGSPPSSTPAASSFTVAASEEKTKKKGGARLQTRLLIPSPNRAEGENHWRRCRLRDPRRNRPILTGRCLLAGFWVKRSRRRARLATRRPCSKV